MYMHPSLSIYMRYIYIYKLLGFRGFDSTIILS